MILSPKDIQELLKKTFSKIRFLETVSATTGRFRSKNIIVFEYTNIAGENLVLKFFSLQKLEHEAKNQEKAELLEEFKRIKSFGNHPNLVRVYDANELWHEGDLVGFYITMEKFADTLAALLRREYRFSDMEVESYLQQMDSILQHAHYKLSIPIVHSDIKPDNIGVRRKEDGAYEYALMDFDISSTLEKSKKDDLSFTLSNKATMRGVSPAYAPPEQVMAYIHKSGEISNRVDIYAVGAVAIEMLTGVKPKKEDGMMYYELPLKLVKGKWRQIFQRLCNPDPKARVRRISDAFSDVVITEADHYKDFNESGPISFKIEQGSIPEMPEHPPSTFSVRTESEEPLTKVDVGFEDELFDHEEERPRTWIYALIAAVVVIGGFLYWNFYLKNDLPFDPFQGLTNGTVTEEISETPPYTSVYQIGQTGPGGGIIFYDKGVFSNGWRFFEVAPSGWFGGSDDPRLQWGCRGVDIRGTGREISHGTMNTNIILENCNESDAAARKASSYAPVVNGQRVNDWFLPSRSELNMIYRNLHLQGIGNMNPSLYWSSSQVNAGFAWVQNFSNGSQNTDFKSEERRVRPIRKF